MKLCFPIEKDEGLASVVCGHFGSAPLFMIIDDQTGDYNTITNEHEHSAHGGCLPLDTLDGKGIEALVLGGIGIGALNKLKEKGITAYQAQYATVGENISRYQSSGLPQMKAPCSGGKHHH